MKAKLALRALTIIVATFALLVSGFVSDPARASDDHGLGTAPTDGNVSGTAGLAADAYVFREHPTASRERVDLPDAAIDKVRDLHKVNFTALVRVVEWARSPRKETSPYGVDRGVYEYKIYEYVNSNGTLRKTGR